MKNLSNTETELKKKALLIKKACNQTNFSISVEPFIKIKSKFRIILYSVFCINYAFPKNACTFVHYYIADFDFDETIVGNLIVIKSTVNKIAV